MSAVLIYLIVFIFKSKKKNYFICEVNEKAKSKIDILWSIIQISSAAIFILHLTVAVFNCSPFQKLNS